MLDAAGVPLPPGLHGKSLLPVLSGEVDEVREFAVSGRFSRSMSLSTKGGILSFRNQAAAFDGTAGVQTSGGSITVSTKRWTYLVPARGDGFPELYDIDADPRQQTDLISRRPDIAADLHAKLLSFFEEVGMAPERVALYRDQLTSPTRSPLLPSDTPVFVYLDDRGQTIAFTDEEEGELAAGPALPAGSRRVMTLDALNAADPAAMVLAFEQYYRADDLL